MHIINYLFEYLAIPLLLTLWGFAERIIFKEKVGDLNLKIYNSGLEFIIISIASCFSICLRAYDNFTIMDNAYFYISALFAIIICSGLVIYCILKKNKFINQQKEKYLLESCRAGYISINILILIIIYYYFAKEKKYPDYNDYIIIFIWFLLSFLVWQFLIYRKIFTDLLDSYYTAEAGENLNNSAESQYVIDCYNKIIKTTLNKTTKIASESYLIFHYLSIPNLRDKGLSQAPVILDKLNKIFKDATNPNIQNLISKVKVYLKTEEEKESFLNSISDVKLKTEIKARLN